MEQNTKKQRENISSAIDICKAIRRNIESKNTLGAEAQTELLQNKLERMLEEDFYYESK
tara:strand:+ start:7425 stop:7601 length:177 start_codon:yes stop_codon:yes gene_type:complete